MSRNVTYVIGEERENPMEFLLVVVVLLAFAMSAVRWGATALNGIGGRTEAAPSRLLAITWERQMLCHLLLQLSGRRKEIDHERYDRYRQ
jgi:hypothetical protein